MNESAAERRRRDTEQSDRQVEVSGGSADGGQHERRAGSEWQKTMRHMSG